MSEHKTAEEWGREAARYKIGIIMFSNMRKEFLMKQELDRYTHAIRMQVMAENNLIPQTNKEDESNNNI